MPRLAQLSVNHWRAVAAMPLRQIDDLPSKMRIAIWARLIPQSTRAHAPHPQTPSLR
jgi:hypothetical protein